MGFGSMQVYWVVGLAPDISRYFYFICLVWSLHSLYAAPRLSHPMGRLACLGHTMHAEKLRHVPFQGNLYCIKVPLRLLLSGS